MAVTIMGNTYSQLSVHVVFAVKGRENFILKPWRDDFHRYIAGIIKAENAFSLAVGGWKDHVHIFFGMTAVTKISDLVGKVKANSSRWMNERKWIPGRFEWQSGYGAFSYSKSQRDAVIKYIIGQEEHHSEISFRQKYLKILHDFEVEYEEKYLFEFYE